MTNTMNVIKLQPQYRLPVKDHMVITGINHQLYLNNDVVDWLTAHEVQWEYFGCSTPKNCHLFLTDSTHAAMFRLRWASND